MVYNNSMKTKTLSSDRYYLIDVIRAAAILSMVVYHLCYDIFVVYEVYPDFWKELPVVLWERSICFTFIIVSGISLHFSHHPYKRGVIVSLCGFAVTIISVLFIPSQQIWFGVLNLIGCAMIVTYALHTLFDRLNAVAGMAGSLLLYALTYSVPKRFIGFFSIPLISLPDALYGCKYCAFLGFPSKDFFSADFFPLLPWLFLFFFGYFLWKFIKERGRDDLFRFDVPVLSRIGRYSLIIYLIHQPLLYLICAAIFGHF